jgi:hypothetical protein
LKSIGCRLDKSERKGPNRTLPKRRRFGYCSSSHSIFSEMTAQGGYVASAFNAFNVHQSWLNLHAIDHLTFLYNHIWPVQAEWERNGLGGGLKRLTQAAFSYRFNSSRCTFWTNSWDPSQPNQRPIFGTIKEKLSLFRPL